MFTVKCGHEYEKIFKEEQPIEILKIVGLINNIDELISRIEIEKGRWNKKLFSWRNKSKWINE